ncbi:MAG: DUF2130 domain-containing protein, partial [Chryseolinea sp.]
METMMSATLLVKCPHCGNRFSPEDSIEHDLREQFEKEYEQKLLESNKIVAERTRAELGEKYKLHLKKLEEESKLKAQKLRQLEENEIRVEQRERQLREREESSEIEMKRRLLDREKAIKEMADKSAMDKAQLHMREMESKLKRDRESIDLAIKKKVLEATEQTRVEEGMKSAELQKKLDDQSKMINEMKRKTEQGSMQTQGEVQELAIEEFLKHSFPRDVIEEISKGKRGGDCVHIVKDHYTNECGRILYESKRTKHFSNDWISKVKDDMRLQQASLGVIVTDALPEGMVRFGELEGVWVCTFVEFRALAFLFRSNMSRIGEVLSAQENKGEKMNLIYSYVTSIEFKQKLEAAFESYSDMHEDLMKEKLLFTSQWAKREKKLLKAMENLS